MFSSHITLCKHRSFFQIQLVDCVWIQLHSIYINANTQRKMENIKSDKEEKTKTIIHANKRCSTIITSTYVHNCNRLFLLFLKQNGVLQHPRSQKYFSQFESA